MVLNKVSKPEGRRVMVHFFLAMMFSCPTRLGWDATVQLVRNPSSTDDSSVDVQYDYTVEDADGTQTIYRTRGLIAESEEGSNRGGLRVWRAVEVRDGAAHGDTVVLKDVWRCTEIPQEGTNMRGVAEPSPQSRLSEEDQEALKHSVLTVLHHGDVLIRANSNGSKENPESPVFVQDRLPAHIRNYGKTLPKQYNDIELISPEWATQWNELSDRRVHYRMVVKELCTSIYEIRWDHLKVYPALAEACEGES